MTDKFLYVFGAGASANAFPTTKDRGEIPGLINSMLTQIPDWIGTLLNGIQPAPDRGLVDFALPVIKSVAEAAKPFGDIDTYAKYLHLKKKQADFFNVKIALSYYFAIRQSVLKHSDDRYLRWLIGIMDESKFPDNVKIISWNYDFQTELASKEFGELESRTMTGSKAAGGISYQSSFIKHYPSLDFDDDRNYSIVHLNGIAGFFGLNFPDTESVYDESDHSREIHPDPRMAIFKKIKEQKASPAVHFAWEGTTASANCLTKAKTLAVGTTILVVVGYSFPFYNRKADNEIFESLMSGGLLPSLKKIYYQDPLINGQQLKSQFGLHNIEIIHINNTANFHIPFEL